MKTFIITISNNGFPAIFGGERQISVKTLQGEKEAKTTAINTLKASVKVWRKLELTSKQIRANITKVEEVV